jgi:Domain of unknown function (DUF4386)
MSLPLETTAEGVLVGALATMVVAASFNIDPRPYDFSGGQFVVPGDPSATRANLLANQTAARGDSLSLALLLTTDVLCAWAFYVLFRRTFGDWSMLSAWFRLGYTFVHLTGVLPATLAVQIALAPTAPTAAAAASASGVGMAAREMVGGNEAQLDGLVLFLLEAHTVSFIVSLWLFAFHLLLLAWFLAADPRYPSVFGAACGLSGVLYVVAIGGYLVLGYDHELVLRLGPSLGMLLGGLNMVGELGLALFVALRFAWQAAVGEKGSGRAKNA